MGTLLRHKGGIILGFNFTEIAEGSPIILIARNDNGVVELKGNLKKHVKPNLALIDIFYSDVDNKRLNFDNVQLDMEFCPDEEVPYIWRNARVASIQNQYVLQVTGEGIRHNRRGSFRVTVAKTALMRMIGRGAQRVMIKDVSITGFAISDQMKELGLSTGDKLSVSFEDLGHQLDLDGTVVRIEEREDMTIYGFEITNLCKDLSSYISLKQRRNRG